MNNAASIGIDLGKHSFHLHAQDGSGRELFRKKTTRPQLIRLLAQQPPCTVAMEACAGAHCLAREIQAQGHAVKLISPQFVRPFVQGNKNDFIDAQAICEAASRPSMRFVTPRNEAQQTLSVLHRLRDSLIRDRTQSINQLGYLDEQIKSLDKEVVSQVEEDDLGNRLLSLPCVGPITTSVLVAELGDGKQYGCSRDFAASVGLVPRQYSTGGRAHLLGISKRGDKSLRRLLVQCARVYLQRLEHQRGALADWVRGLLVRRHSNVVACALANKLGRIAWAIATKHTRYEAGPDGCAA